MAQNQRKKKAASKNTAGNGKALIYILLVIVGIAGAITIGASAGSDKSPTVTVATVPGGVDPNEYQKVSVSGDTLVALPDSGTDPAVGKAAPTLNGFDHYGRPAVIAPGTTGQATMVVFLAHWCPHCNAEVPVLNKWRESGKVPANLRVVGVTTASKNDQAMWPPSQWLVDMKWPFDVMADSQDQTAAQAYGVGGYPFLVFIDAKGNVTQRASGEIAVEDLQKYADAAVAGA